MLECSGCALVVFCASGVEWRRVDGFGGILLSFRAVDRFDPWIGRLVFLRWFVMEFYEGPDDAAGHGDVNAAVLAIPIKGEAAAEGT